MVSARSARSRLTGVACLVALLLAACTSGAEPDGVGSGTPASSAPSEASDDVGALGSEPSVPPATSLPVAPPAAPVASPAPVFSSAISEITPDLALRMAPSWREGCPVPLADLRYVTVSHHTFDGTVVTGELVVHGDVAEGVTGVFGSLFEQGYPIRSMRLVDDFGADDYASMAADNTSAFNCRAITGGTAWSEHAYGKALDLNPVENPYVLGRHVAPPEGRAYADRPDLPGVIHDGDAVVAAFAAAGWQWGGHWSSPVDYQHFSVTGR